MDLKAILECENVVSLYRYGSTVYGTTDELSDEDFVCIVRDKEIPLPCEVEGQVYDIEEFQWLLDRNHFTAIESFYLAHEHILKNGHEFTFEINKPELRKFVSGISSKSFCKCKKKLIDGEIRTGMKSLWHCLRIPLFAIQLLKFDKIEYSCYNDLWSEVMAEEPIWSELKPKYNAMRNEIMTEFRILCPKE